MKLVINAMPMGKERPRTVRKGNKIIIYTPKKTEHLTNLIRDKVIKEKGYLGAIPLRVTIIHYISRPKSAPKSRVYPTVRPDLDNLNKLVLDALQGFAYADDGQIVTLVSAKRYTIDSPRIEVEIETKVEIDIFPR